MALLRTFESVLAELALLRGNRGHYQLVRGPKRSLAGEVFAYTLIEYWDRLGPANTLSFEAIAHEPGSPGRVFLLDENEVADRLSEIGELTAGALEWSETAGLKQVVRSRVVHREEALKLLHSAYAARSEEAP